MTRPPTRTTSVPGVLLPAAALLLALAPAAGLRADGPKKPSPSPCPASAAELYEAVAPAVVSVTAMAVDPHDAFDRMNRQAGSGVLIDEGGLVLTNSHVVFGRQAISVTLDDGTVLPARIVGVDPIYDIGLLRIPVPDTGTLPKAAFAESSRIRVGDEVYAIGNPFGLEQTLTRGIVSAVNRILPGASWSLREPLIQSDAAINHGNSGGPLVDRCGKVVGINTAMLPDAQGIGFAIPSDLIRSVLPELAEKGRVIRPWLGVQGQLVPPAWKEVVRLPPVDGFLVEVVEPGSPAAQAGLQGGDTDVVLAGVPLLLGGDMIVEMNGQAVSDPSKMADSVAALKVGETVRMTVVRGGSTFRLEVPLVERPLLPQDVPSSRATAPTTGNAAAGLAPRFARRSL
ncbi:MAG: trypsin-like peptidase domain-containing protein [Thermoanaerobaculia bacterium]